MHLSDRDKELIKGYIDRGEPLPPRYKLVLFADAPDVELIWQGKTSEVTSAVLPFQSIEQVDEPRKEPGKMEQVGGNAGLFGVDAVTGRQSGGWSNKLVWGDNKLVLSSLKNGPMRKAIEDAGGLKLVYIDPPFAVEADFSIDIEIGDEILHKEPSVVEEIAYRDTWGRGADSFLAMIYERLVLIRALLADDASVYVHVDWRLADHLRLVLDEVFGPDHYQACIRWKRQTSSGYKGIKRYGRAHDSVFWYSKSSNFTFNTQYVPYAESYIKSHYSQFDEKGRQYRAHWLGTTTEETIKEYLKTGRVVRRPDGSYEKRLYLDEQPGTPVDDIWTDVLPLNSQAIEDTKYPTQKSEALAERILLAASDPGDLVADFFCGSGTTLAVAEKLGRKWIGCDLGRFAIHTTRKRLIGVQRQLKAEGKSYRSFEILNLGKYERQYFVGIDPTLPEKERREEAVRREEHYLSLILTAYKAERAFQAPPFHGKKNAAMVVVGPIDAPVTQSQVAEVVAACARMRVSKVDVLGFEFEMGLAPQAQDDAKVKGVTLNLKYIPKDVFDKRAVEKGQVKFYDVAYVEVKPKVSGKKVSVELTDFGVFYQQDAASEIAEELKPGGSRVTVEAGQVVKVSKDKKGVVTKDRLTKKWTDWIDYWAVDFDYQSRPEIIRTQDATNPPEYREVATGNYIFENEWQSYRTRKDRSLELKSVEREYPNTGKYKIAVKVIDIFGNDTTKVIEVKV